MPGLVGPAAVSYCGHRPVERHFHLFLGIHLRPGTAVMPAHAYLEAAVNHSGHFEAEHFPPKDAVFDDDIRPVIGENPGERRGPIRIRRVLISDPGCWLGPNQPPAVNRPHPRRAGKLRCPSGHYSGVGASEGRFLNEHVKFGDSLPPGPCQGGTEPPYRAVVHEHPAATRHGLG
jgi:hypothetical protein